MYRYLDRAVGQLDPGERLLVWSMRNWVLARSRGRCPCTALGPAFLTWGIGELLSDFNTTMLVLNGESQASLCFGAVCCREVSDDEARLLTLFDAARNGNEPMVRRLADQLVQPQAVWHLATAVERVTTLLSDAPALWDAPRAAEG